MMPLVRRRSLKLLLLVLALPALVLLLSLSWHNSRIPAPVKKKTDVSDLKLNSSEKSAGQSQTPQLVQKTDQAPHGDLKKTARPISRDVDDPLEIQAAQNRVTMVNEQLAGRDITDKAVLKAMREVPRHLFVPEGLQDLAYTDRPLPIGLGQTISQPYIVALMTQLGQLDKSARVLDVGTGSGYQAAVLAKLVKQVYSIEILCPLADEARQRLERLGYDNVEVRCGDGHLGWFDHAPFDVIIVAAASEHVPQSLIDQLAPGGRLVIPVGKYFQELIVIEKQSDGSVKRRLIAPVAFVPMTGGKKAGGKVP